MEVETVNNINDDNSLSLCDYVKRQATGPNSTKIEFVHSKHITEDSSDDHRVHPDHVPPQAIGPNSTDIELVHSKGMNEDGSEDHRLHPDDVPPQATGPSSTNIELVHSKDMNEDGSDNHRLHPDYVPPQMKEVAVGGMKEEPLSVSTIKANMMKSNLEHDTKDSYLNNLLNPNPNYSWEIKAGYKDLPLLKFHYSPFAPFHGLAEEIQKYKIPPKSFKLELRHVHVALPPKRIQLKFAIIDV